MELIETNDGLKAVLELSEAEIKWWRKTIGDVRKKTIPAAGDAVDNFFTQYIDDVGRMVHASDISALIREARDKVWRAFIGYEVDFFAEVIGTLIREREAPKSVLEALINPNIAKQLANATDKEELLAIVADIFQDYTGRIFPYLYELSKSQTNSRRSRAGKEFESIIDHLMRRLAIPYDSQSHIGQRLFAEKGLGKKVDGVIPNVAAFNHNRSRCIIATMKTSIRERWTEVVEELNRTNIPIIHLLTLDEGITANVLTLMKNHNMTLVTYDNVKNQFSDFSNIMDFETFFGSEIPHTLDWWQRNAP